MPPPSADPHAYYVAPRFAGGWAVRRGTGQREVETFERKADAERFAIERARKDVTRLYIHRENGTVSEMRSYA